MNNQNNIIYYLMFKSIGGQSFKYRSGIYLQPLRVFKNRCYDPQDSYSREIYSTSDKNLFIQFRIKYVFNNRETLVAFFSLMIFSVYLIFLFFEIQISFHRGANLGEKSLTQYMSM